MSRPGDSSPQRDSESHRLSARTSPMKAPSWCQAPPGRAARPCAASSSGPRSAAARRGSADQLAAARPRSNISSISKREHRRVGGEQRRRPPGSTGARRREPKRRVAARTPRSSPRPAAPPASAARARRRRGRSRRRSASAASRGTRPRTSRQPSRRIPARSSSGREVLRSDLGEALGLGQAVEVGRRDARARPRPRRAARMPARWRSCSSRRSVSRSRRARFCSVSRSISREESPSVPGKSSVDLGRPSATAVARPSCCLRARWPLLTEPHIRVGSLPAGRAGAPTTVAPGGTSSTTTAFAPICAPAPIRTGPITLAPGPDADVALDRRALHVARAQPDRDPGADHGARVDLHEAVGHDLAVHDVDARVHNHRVADRDLRQRHRQPVRQTRQDRHPQRLESGLHAVQGLGEEGVADPGEPHDLQREIDRCAELVALAPVAGRHARVSGERLAQVRMAGADLTPYGLALALRGICGSRAHRAQPP